MQNINFVPDNYIQNKESHRTKLICPVFFGDSGGANKYQGAQVKKNEVTIYD